MERKYILTQGLARLSRVSSLNEYSPQSLLSLVCPSASSIIIANNTLPIHHKSKMQYKNLAVLAFAAGAIAAPEKRQATASYDTCVHLTEAMANSKLIVAPVSLSFQSWKLPFPRLSSKEHSPIPPLSTPRLHLSSQPARPQPGSLLCPPTFRLFSSPWQATLLLSALQSPM